MIYRFYLQFPSWKWYLSASQMAPQGAGAGRLDRDGGEGTEGITGLPAWR